VLITLAVIAAARGLHRIEDGLDQAAQNAISSSPGRLPGSSLPASGGGWRGRKAAIMTVVLVGFSALTWAAHARLGALLLKP